MSFPSCQVFIHALTPLILSIKDCFAFKENQGLWAQAALQKERPPLAPVGGSLPGKKATGGVASSHDLSHRSSTALTAAVWV